MTNPQTGSTTIETIARRRNRMVATFEPISDPDAWNSWPHLSKRWCPYDVIMWDRVAHESFREPKPCDSWQCPDCAEGRARELLGRLAAWGFDVADMYSASVVIPDKEERRKLAKKLSDNAGNRRAAFVRVTRMSGRVIVVASQPIGGRSLKMTPEPDPLGVLTKALDLPGVEVRPVGTSRHLRNRPSGVPLEVQVARFQQREMVTDRMRRELWPVPELFAEEKDIARTILGERPKPKRYSFVGKTEEKAVNTGDLNFRVAARLAEWRKRTGEELDEVQVARDVIEEMGISVDSEGGS